MPSYSQIDMVFYGASLGSLKEVPFLAGRFTGVLLRVLKWNMCGLKTGDITRGYLINK